MSWIIVGSENTRTGISKLFLSLPYLCAFYPPWSLPRPDILPKFQFRIVTLTRPDILPAHCNLTRTITNDACKISGHND